MRNVGIIGMGWIGLQLAKKLKIKGYKVHGTVSSADKQAKIKNDFSDVEVFVLDTSNMSELWKNEQINHFVLTIPPSSSKDYGAKIKELTSHLFDAHPTANLIYTSSTSVYGSETRIVSEESETEPETDNAKKIVEIEGHLTKNYKLRSTIIRLGGLVGEDRHPVKYLSGRTGISKGQSPVNLVHSDDVCNLITHLIERKLSSGIFNLCCEDHPPKKEYYSWVAERLKIDIPKFDPLDLNTGKVVNCDAIKKINFGMNYNSPYDFPINNFDA